MVLQVSAVDALVAGVATAFFGGLLASGAYLLKQILVLKEHMASLAARMGQVDAMQQAIGTVGDQAMDAKVLSGRRRKRGDDGAEKK